MLKFHKVGAILSSADDGKREVHTAFIAFSPLVPQAERAKTMTGLGNIAEYGSSSPSAEPLGVGFPILMLAELVELVAQDLYATFSAW
jgi:hypothetical protein